MSYFGFPASALPHPYFQLNTDLAYCVQSRSEENSKRLSSDTKPRGQTFLSLCQCLTGNKHSLLTGASDATTSRVARSHSPQCWQSPVQHPSILSTSIQLFLFCFLLLVFLEILGSCHSFICSGQPSINSASSLKPFNTLLFFNEPEFLSAICSPVSWYSYTMQKSMDAAGIVPSHRYRPEKSYF